MMFQSMCESPGARCQVCTGGVHLPVAENTRRVTGSVKVSHTAGLSQGKSPHSFGAKPPAFPWIRREYEKQELNRHKVEADLLLSWSPFPPFLLWLLVLQALPLSLPSPSSQPLGPCLVRWPSLCLIPRVAPQSRHPSDCTDEKQTRRG